MNIPRRCTYLGRTTFRNRGTAFGIYDADRRYHACCIGKTGTGKSTLLAIMAAQDVVRRNGFALFDPHGSLISLLQTFVSTNHDSAIILDAADSSSLWRFNPFFNIPRTKHALAAAGIVEVFKKIWSDGWGARLEHLLRNVVLTVLEIPGGSFNDIPRLLTDKDFRRASCDRLTNEAVRSFWEDEYARYSPAFRAVVIAPLQNKLSAILTDPNLNRILTSPGPQLDFRQIMDDGRVLLVNLDRGQMGEGPASLLGSLLVSHIALAGLSRSDQPEEERRDFTVYLDEFHSFTTLSLITMLAELRKYRVGMVLAWQFLAQIATEIRDAVFGNVGTIINFRVGGADAAFLAREFAPTFEANDLTSLPKFQMYLRLCIDGEMSKPFSAVTFRSPKDIPRWIHGTST